MANETKAMLPPGVSAQDFQTALKEWEKIVGSEYVFAQPENLASYNKIMIPDAAALHQPSGAVAPANVEEIQAILKVANRYRIPLWVISTGKNLGYGSAAPTTAGQVVLDLKRMNRILEVDEEMGTALVEPGVTYLQLKQYLDERKIPLWLSFPSSGPIAGPVGNTLDRGVGYSRYGEHFANFCGLEVVLADGLVVRTATGGVKGNNTWQSYRWGYGPWVDGLFSQSNFGIRLAAFTNTEANRRCGVEGNRKPHRGSQLVARLDYFQDQQKGPITRAEFLARALKAANDKARELGWIV